MGLAQVMRVLLAAFEGDRAVLDRRMQEECETEYERLEMARAARVATGSGSSDGACPPLRECAPHGDLVAHDPSHGTHVSWIPCGWRGR